MKINKTRIKFTVAYDGTEFCGWQKQNHEDRPSVCQTLQTALEKVFQHEITLFASGRTDAGVHAVAQVSHFDTHKKMPADLCWSLRALLPPSITFLLPHQVRLKKTLTET